MMPNHGAWGHQVGMAALLRERSYLLDVGERRGPSPAEPRPASPQRRGLRERPRALRLVLTAVALLVRMAAPRG